MPQNRKKNGIPDRWLDYTAVGRRLPGTRFIAFKVPLKRSLNRHLPRRDVFGPWELLDAVEKENEQLGLVIDLTFTTRYYKLQDLPASLLFVKILTAGHEIPSNETILSFKRAVRHFLRSNADNDKLIGVHCTHGLNRTGYLICRYLIDVDGMDPKQAVKLFNSARGHDMERQNYLDDLQAGQKRSNAGMEESETQPLRGLAQHRTADDEGGGRETERPPNTQIFSSQRQKLFVQSSSSSRRPPPRPASSPPPAFLSTNESGFPPVRRPEEETPPLRPDLVQVSSGGPSLEAASPLAAGRQEGSSPSPSSASPSPSSSSSSSPSSSSALHATLERRAERRRQTRGGSEEESGIRTDTRRSPEVI